MFRAILKSTKLRPFPPAQRRLHLTARSLSSSSNPTSLRSSLKVNWLNPTMCSLVLVVLFGSQVLNIISIKKETAQLQHRYDEKIRVLEQCIARLRVGEDVNVTKELRRIQKVFKSIEYLKAKDYEALERLNDEYDRDEEDEEGEEAAKEVNDSLGELFRESLFDDGKVTEKVTAAQPVNKREEERVEEPVETIVIKDEPGAMEDAASTRKITKFL